VIVKIDNPKGNYYGGLTAAPVTRSMLEQALASQRVAIDRARLAAPDSTASAEIPPESRPAGRPVVALRWPYHPSDSVTSPRPIPDVAGRSVREAALALHRRGFQVGLRGLGRVVRTEPAAGQSAARGFSVIIWAE
jgi:cell division protein FtsI (penicillin-binding protein 3)